MPLTKRTFNVGPSETRTGYLYTPEGTGPFPLVAFFHGMGKAGDWPDALLEEGPLFHVNKGWKPNFMILALQNPSWTVPANKMKYAVDNDTEIKAKWNGKNILWTGLSAGGQPVQDAMAMGYPGAFVPMSMAGGTPVNYKAGPFKLWAFHATNEGPCPFITSKSLVDGCNAAFPGSAKLTEMKNEVTGIPDGHGNWNKYYDPTYRENGKNIYEFAFDLSGTTDKVPPPPPPAPSTLKAVATVTNLTANSATLDGSKSEGKIAWAGWELLTQPKGSDWNVFPNFKKDSLVLNVQNLSPGSYTFKLNLLGEGGGAMTTVTFTVGAIKSPTFAESAIPAGKTHVKVLDDKTFEWT